MTLEKTLLQKLAEWRPDQESSALTVSGEGGWIVSLDGQHNEAVAARVRSLTLSRPEAVADLQGWATRLCDRATGLLEALRPVEFDGENGIAQLRSESPTRRDEAITYYEVLLHKSGKATVGRYQAAADGTRCREPVAFALTHETIAKLVHDLIASA